MPCNDSDCDPTREECQVPCNDCDSDQTRDDCQISCNDCECDPTLTEWVIVNIEHKLCEVSVYEDSIQKLLLFFLMKTIIIIED